VPLPACPAVLSGALGIALFTAETLSIDFFSMPDVHDQHDKLGFSDFVNHAVIPNAYSPSVTPRQLFAPMRLRLISQRTDSFNNPILILRLYS
jgi:hypothetical protein